MATQGSRIAIQLRASPTLRHRLPTFEGATAIELHLAPGATVADAAGAVGIDLGIESLVCVLNSRVAEPGDELHDGDQVRLMHRIAGGS